LPVRLDPELRRAVDEAAIENTALSEVMREAVASLKDRRRSGSA
jgi:predicted transcriptional regulator